MSAPVVLHPFCPRWRLPQDQLTVTGHKGFRMARATKGVSNGTW
ncbi:unnamed protein product, partial [Ectocarpus sp. 12 AP-2014]